MGRALDDPEHPEAPAGVARRVRESDQPERALAARQQVGFLARVARADDLLAIEPAKELLAEELEEVGGRHGTGPRREGIVGNNLLAELGAEQVLRHSDRGWVHVVPVRN